MFNCLLHNVTSQKSRMFNLSAVETLTPCCFELNTTSNLRRALIFGSEKCEERVRLKFEVVRFMAFMPGKNAQLSVWKSFMWWSFRVSVQRGH